MKSLITNYSFNKTAKTVTFSDYVSISLERILLITNVTDGIIIYNFTDPAKGGTVATNVLTLDHDTSAMDNTDKLQIFYEDDQERLDKDLDSVTAFKDRTGTANTPAISSGATALASNTLRKGFFLQNLGTNPLFVRLGSGASSTVFHVLLKGGTANDDGLGAALSDETYTGIVTIAGTSPRYTVTEY